jgi:EAL domain-containing protein (putative c-di-GMP-specific phosphodiesterase class I)
VSICHALNIRVLAEGIETALERDCLREAGIHLMQGDFFARPAFWTLGTIDVSIRQHHEAPEPFVHDKVAIRKVA